MPTAERRARERAKREAAESAEAQAAHEAGRGKGRDGSAKAGDDKKPGSPPPKAGAGSAGKRGPGRPSRQQLQEDVAAILKLPAIPMMAAGDLPPANYISQVAPMLAESAVDVAKESETVERILRGLVTGGTVGTLVMNLALYALGPAVYYGLAPPQYAAVLGVEMPNRMEYRHAAAAASTESEPGPGAAHPDDGAAGSPGA